MPVIPDVTPVFAHDPDAEPADVVPALARLLIDMARREKLTNGGPPIMLKESPLAPGTPWSVSPCPAQN